MEPKKRSRTEGGDSAENYDNINDAKKLHSEEPNAENKDRLRTRQRINYKDGMSLKELEGHRTILHKRQNSSHTRCEIVKYLFYCEFEKRKPEVCLKKATVEECLYHALKFTSNVEVKDGDEFKIDGKTKEEVYDYYSKNVPGFSWVIENDNANLHDLMHDEYKEVVNFFSKHAELKFLRNMTEQKIYGYANFMKTICTLFEEVYQNSNEDDTEHDDLQPSFPLSTNEDEVMVQQIKSTQTGENSTSDLTSEISESGTGTNTEGLSIKKWTDLSKRSALVKEYLEGVALMLPFRNYRRNGQCRTEIQLVVENPDLTPNNKLIEDKKAEIIVKPDGVLVGPASSLDYQFQDVWMLVVEVYGPFSEDVIAAQSPEHSPSPSPTRIGRGRSISPFTNRQRKSPSPVSISRGRSRRRSSAPPVVISEKWSNKKKDQEMGPPLPPPRRYLGQTQPMRSCNLMSNPEYCAELRSSIQESVPIYCTTAHCMDKIAGQHVLQLFSMAQETILKNEKKNLIYNETDECAKAIGLFIVNEYVYFSKLLVEKKTMMYLNDGTTFHTKKIPQLLQEGKKRPNISYGNFRFDLAIANHRKAFIIFLNQMFLKNDMDTIAGNI